jgi:TrmH family RNA methyltransferase
VQRLRRLEGQRAARWEEGRFVAEGPKLLGEALAAGVVPETVFFEAAAGPELELLVGSAARAGADVVEVGPGVLRRVTSAVAPQPVVSVLAMVHVPLAALPPGLAMVGAGLADPGNAGAIVRSAAAAGAGAVVLCAGGVDPYHPKAVRATAGALFRVPVVAGTAPGRALEELGRRGFTRLGAAAHGGTDHDRVDWCRPVAVVVGNESRGLDPELAGQLDGAVTVAMTAGSESLNAAMAATVICFEAARQRRRAGVGAS